MKEEFLKFCDEFKDCESCPINYIKGNQDHCYIDFLEKKIDELKSK
jgi:hypothetical protein